MGSYCSCSGSFKYNEIIIHNNNSSFNDNIIESIPKISKLKQSAKNNDINNQNNSSFHDKSIESNTKISKLRQNKINDINIPNNSSIHDKVQMESMQKVSKLKLSVSFCEEWICLDASYYDSSFYPEDESLKCKSIEVFEIKIN